MGNDPVLNAAEPMVELLKESAQAMGDHIMGILEAAPAFLGNLASKGANLASDFTAKTTTSLSNAGRAIRNTLTPNAPAKAVAPSHTMGLAVAPGQSQGAPNTQMHARFSELLKANGFERVDLQPSDIAVVSAPTHVLSNQLFEQRKLDQLQVGQ